MSDVLERAVEAFEIVGALKPYGVTQTDVAATTGVSDLAVRGWRESAIPRERYDRLAELRDLVLLLAESLTPRGVNQWLHTGTAAVASGIRAFFASGSTDGPAASDKESEGRRASRR